ncbi:MAG: hypothetical protein R3B93_16755 [Bacteroidia bacterium]
MNGCIGNIDSAILTVKAKTQMDAGAFDQSICEEDGSIPAGKCVAANNAGSIAYFIFGFQQQELMILRSHPYARPTKTTIYARGDLRQWM